MEDYYILIHHVEEWDMLKAHLKTWGTDWPDRTGLDKEPFKDDVSAYPIVIAYTPDRNIVRWGSYEKMEKDEYWNRKMSHVVYMTLNEFLDIYNRE